jgi:hypothetical protein
MKSWHWLRLLLVLIASWLILDSSSQSVEAGNEFTFSLSAPDFATYGRRPIEVVAKVTNQTEMAQSFTAVVWIGGPAWGGDTFIQVTHGNVYFNCVAGSCTLTWNGYLEPRSVAQMTVFTSTGPNLGTYTLSHGYLVAPNSSPTITRQITLSAGTDPLAATMKFQNYTHRIQRDRWDGLEMIASWPTLGQLVSNGPMTSTCGVEGLPVTFSSGTNRTYQHFYWGAVHIPANAPLGICVISAPVKVAGTNQTFTVQFQFWVLP